MGPSQQAARPAPPRLLVGLLVPTGLGACSALLVWSASAPVDAVRAPGPAPVDALLALGAALACAGLLAAAALGAALCLAGLLTGQVAGRIERLSETLTPAVVRAAVALAVGVTVAGGPITAPALSLVAGPAGSGITTSGAGDARAGRSTVPATLPPGWTADRPAATSARPRVPGRVATPPTQPVVVVRGDTLWAIAARRLGRSASDEQVAAEWPRWHAANLSTIGRDPDLIFPGQRLRPPGQSPPTDRPPIDREEPP